MASGHVKGWQLTARNMGRGLYLKAGPADDVMQCHYGACDTCRVFGDAVCVTVPATAVCVRKRQCRSRAA